MKLRYILLGVLASLAGALGVRGQTVYTWTGITDDFNYFNASNWQGHTVPPDDIANTQLRFASALNTHVRYYQIYVNQILFSGITKSFWLEGDYDTTHIGSGGITYAPASSITSYFSGNVRLEASQIWDIQSGKLVFDGSISDNSANFLLVKMGAGTLKLYGYSGWTGGFTLSAGNVEVDGYDDGSVNPFGTGILTFDGGTLIAARDYYAANNQVVEISNDMVSNGVIKTVNYVPLLLDGDLSLHSSTSVVTSGKPTFIDGNITETVPASLTMNGTGVLVLGGTNTYTGGTVVNNGILIFGQVPAIPANPATNAISVAVNAYAGLGDDDTETYDVQTDFINRFNKATTFGTIGLDTDPSLGTTTDFTSNIDLTGFAASVKLGSATSAEISGTITPQGTDYRFGGGGGFLIVSSRLTGARNLVVDSPTAYPLTLWLTDFSNDFTGTMTVTNSALVFADTALPSGSRTISVGAGGYVGTETANSGSPTPDDSDISFFLGHITTSSTGMIGFDAFSSFNRNLARDINLSVFTGQLYLGTATIGYLDDGVYGGTELSGLITTTNGGVDPYRFAGYKGGVLLVDSNLTGSHGIVIGDPNSPGTFGDPSNGRYSAVYLNGDNTAMTGNVTLYGGILAVGQQNGIIGTNPTSALGTGTLIVQGMSLPASWTALGDFTAPAIYSEAYQEIISNPITLNSSLRLNHDTAWLQLSGRISGVGGLYLEPHSELSLLNDTNNFTGGIYLGNYSTLHLGADHASSSGVISFGSSGAVLSLDTLTPLITGIASTSDDDFSTILATLTNTVLTINQSTDSVFRGEFRSSQISGSDNFRVVKSGTGTLDLDDGGFYFYHGTVEASLPLSPQVGLQVNQGTVVLRESFYFENNTPTIWVHGGTLILDNNRQITSDLYVDNNGRLQGSGQLYSATTLFSSSVISPGVAGVNQVGSLTFDTLTLMGGATLEVTIKDPNGNPGEGWDLVSISDFSFTLHVDTSVTAATPFNIKLVTLNASGAPGAAVGFLNQTYTWTIFDASNSTIVFHNGSFDPTAFHLDTSAFSADIGPGNFSFVQNGNLLQVNFTPVPEPSTYVLFGLGFVVVALRFQRRRAA